MHTPKKTHGRIELMAPAGEFSALQAALDAGANSVYFGVDQLNMRARASNNFSIDDLPEIMARCHAKDTRAYLTLNTIMYDHDISLVARLIEHAKAAGVDAVIASDLAVISQARSAGMAVHISTQLNVTNVESVRFFAPFADVMVLSRELSLGQVRTITDSIREQKICGPSGKLVRIEIFAHGALCMAVSGKCYLSLHTHNSSANRGACVQNCRRTYTVIDNETGHELAIDNEYIMSAKDLCTIHILDQIADAGVEVIKIEGRGRSADYVYETVSCYREALESLTDGTYGPEKVEGWRERLATVYNRGFWTGYYLGQEIGEWHHTSTSIATQKKIYLGKVMHYFPKAGIAEVLVEAHTVKAGDRLLFTGPTTGVFYAAAEGMLLDDQPALEAAKGSRITIKVPEKVRLSDKVFKVLPAEEA